MTAKETGKGLAAVWFKFFLDAGVPASDAGNYAVKFTEHRIQPDMLSELTKEYLNDMGITLLGDVIVILKHARSEHAKMSKEQALKFSGLSAQSSSSSSSVSFDVPSATKTVSATTKRPKIAAPKAADAGIPATGSVHTSNVNVGSIAIDEPRRTKSATATAPVVTNAARRQLPKQPLLADPSVSRPQLSSNAALTGKTVATSSAVSLQKRNSLTAVKSQTTPALVNDLSRNKSTNVTPLMSLPTTASKTQAAVFARLGDKLPAFPSLSSQAAASSADRNSSGLTKTKTVRDRLGPATTDFAMESSKNSSLANPRPKLMISTKRKPVAETVSTTPATGLQLGTGKLNTKSSIMSRLGKPASSDSTSSIMIPTKRKLADVTAALAGADQVATKLVTKPSVKSRLGEPVMSNPLQQSLLMSTKPKQVVKMVTDTGMQFAGKLSIRSRLGERASSEIQSPVMIPTKRKGGVDDDDGYIVSAKYQTIFSRLGPNHI